MIKDLKFFPNGYYLVGNYETPNKIDAFLYSTKVNLPVKWVYFNEIFINAVKNFEKKEIDLTHWYRLRAQQLRSKYDYLILNYSGGSDSHNILMTFLKNNIRLDCIYVQWPESLVDKGLYSPNTIDKSNSNFHSEWDFVLKEDLVFISKNYPEIVIEIGDWTKTLKENFYSDIIFEKNVTNLPSIARSQKQNTFSDFENKKSRSGKTVGSIFGVDKPEIFKKQDKWYFYFTDTGCMAQPNPENPFGLEYFYWTPDMPELVIAQCIKLRQFYLSNQQHLYLITSLVERALIEKDVLTRNYTEFYREYALRAEISKLVCYPYWNFNRFQADKPFSKLDGFKMGTRGWDNILVNIPEFDKIQKTWEYLWKSYLSGIDNKLMRSRDTFGVVKSPFVEF